MLRTLPIQTFFVVVVTLLIAAVPEWSATLTTTRANASQIWPLVTGHLCHWTREHLIWDLVAFATFGPIVERRLRQFLLPLLAAAMLLCSTIVLLLMPEIESYRGLSAVDFFLCAFAGLEFYRKTARKSVSARVLSAVFCFGIFGKLLFEFASGQTIFATSLGPNVSALPLAHLVGALLGGLVWISLARRAPEDAPANESLGRRGSDIERVKTAVMPSRE